MDGIKKLKSGTKEKIAIFGSYFILIFSSLMLPYYWTIILLFVAWIVIGIYGIPKKKKTTIRSTKWHPFHYL